MEFDRSDDMFDTADISRRIQYEEPTQPIWSVDFYCIEPSMLVSENDASKVLLFTLIR
ncbi:hypothetical protein HanXRQr2_Chr10g0449401 [Helianthus annuus]|uniref:Uncharacterized protein n=1 Tax=Helianthus annuus TaxID=4232 RepID=A0A9K3HYK7_HELAN|nr:hypothetical protein HanXRQr2_Chr10g0449401 [Helianthus annuus]